MISDICVDGTNVLANCKVLPTNLSPSMMQLHRAATDNDNAG
jgi:hypothetical protein